MLLANIMMVISVNKLTHDYVSSVFICFARRLRFAWRVIKSLLRYVCVCVFFIVFARLALYKTNPGWYRTLAFALYGWSLGKGNYPRAKLPGVERKIRRTDAREFNLWKSGHIATGVLRRGCLIPATTCRFWGWRREQRIPTPCVTSLFHGGFLINKNNHRTYNACDGTATPFGHIHTQYLARSSHLLLLFFSFSHFDIWSHSHFHSSIGHDFALKRCKRIESLTYL